MLNLWMLLHLTILLICITFTIVSSQDDRGVYLGKLNTRFHRIGGELYALDQDKLLYSGYSQDGFAPGIVVRYRLAGTQSYITATKYISEHPWSIKCGHWQLLAPTAYLPRTGTWDVVVLLKDASGQPQDVQMLEIFDVYCALASSKMAEFRDTARFRDVEIVDKGSLAQEISQIEGQDRNQCHTYIEWSCHQLSPQMNLHWKLDAQRNGLIKFRLEGNIMDDEYMAVGISGSVDTFQMTGGDVVVVYQFEDRFYAQDYFISRRAQCGVSGEGTCPDTNHPGATDDITSIEGRKNGKITEVSYTRLNVTSDKARDRVYKIKGLTQIIWAIGKRSADNYPLYHSQRIHDNLELDLCLQDTCPPLSGSREIDAIRWQPSCIEKQQELRFELGPSGGSRGYSSITDYPSWGIAYYINGNLIPYVVVERGQVYRIRTKTSDQHPVYIASNDKYGGYKSQVIENGKSPANIKILAGIDPLSGNSTATGSLGGFCEYTEPQLDSYLSHTTYESYRSSLNYSCDDGDDDQPWAEFNWTVPSRDESDDSEVFYQCSIHQHLGWRFVIVDPGTDSGVCDMIKSLGLEETLAGLSDQGLTTTASPESSGAHISALYIQQLLAVLVSLTILLLCIQIG